MRTASAALRQLRGAASRRWGIARWARRPSFTGTRGSLPSVRVGARRSTRITCPTTMELREPFPGTAPSGGCHAAPDQPTPTEADSNGTRDAQAHLGDTRRRPVCFSPCWGFGRLHPPRRRPRRGQRLAQGRRHHPRGGHPRVQQDAAAVVPSVARHQRLSSACSRAARARTSPSSSTRSACARAARFCSPVPPCSRACAPTPTPTLRSRRSRPPCSRRSCASPTATNPPRPTCSSTADAARAVHKPPTASGSPGSSSWPRSSSRRHLSVESAADLLLLADAHSCPQLKESATELFVSKAPR